MTSSAAPAGLQWTLSYSPTDVRSISATAGAALTGAGKNLNCAGSSGTFTCVASGMNTNAISNGVAAVVSVTLASTSSGFVPITVKNPMAVSAGGVSTSATGNGGSITVAQSTPPAVSGISCTPSAIAAGANSTCTVTLSQAAPSGGVVVALSDNSGLLTAPTSVTVAAGATKGTFTATAGTVKIKQSATVTATLNGSSANATLTLTRW